MATPRKPGASDQRRRRAQAMTDDRDKAPLMMFFRAESILSWGEFVKVNRASDDDPDDNAGQVANDMDQLAIAPDGQSAASRVKFDLDLPSAAADDRPLGPGRKFPEWDFRRNALLPEHCAVQTFLATPAGDLYAARRPACHRPARAPPAGGAARRRWATCAASPRATRSTSTPGCATGWRRPAHPHSESPAVFTRRVRTERSLATLLLADLSLVHRRLRDQHAARDRRDSRRALRVW